MTEGESQTKLASTVRTIQIIVAALCMGIVTFGVFVVVSGEDGKEAKAEMLTYMSLGMLSNHRPRGGLDGEQQRLVEEQRQLLL